jgi:MFS family permease
MSSSQPSSLTEPSPPSDQSTPLLQEDRQVRYESPPPPPPDPEEVVSWSSLPKKGQLAVIVFARLAEPLSERSLTSYLFYQLRWLGPDLSTAEIAAQAGYLTAMFAVAQCFTSMWWGHAADNPLLGRKRVLVIGLTGSCVSALGMGFSTSIYAVFFFRFLAGALNGNVGVLRTMISEVVDDRRFVLLGSCIISTERLRG